MAESAFEKLAAAEAEAERIKQAGAENQRAQIQKARADGDAMIAQARKNAKNGLEALDKKLAERDGESRENIEREIKIKCSLVRTKAEERRKAALDYIFRGVTNGGN